MRSNLATVTTETEAQMSTSAPPSPSAGRVRHQRSKIRSAVEWAIILVAALLVALLVRATVVQAFYIPSESMVPTLKVHDRLLVDKLTFQVRDIRRSEIIVFGRPPAVAENIHDLVKRVIGLPGDTVEGRDGVVVLNGQPLAEPYLPKGTVTSSFPAIRVPLDSYFVMGDNRAASYDSRFWGTVDRSLVVGRAFIRVYPPNRFGRF